jgi:sulfite exporter TauE/SafE
MLYSLLLTALLMGVAGLPHCSAMCAAPCSVVAPEGVSWRVLLGRSLGYGLLGAVAAGTTGALSSWSRWVGVLQPVWVMLLAATVLLGLAMAWSGTMPAYFQRQGQQAYVALRRFMTRSPLAVRWPALAGAVPVMVGMAWAALPCGLIYAAVTVATLAPSPFGGALVMVAFSCPGAVALWWLPRRLAATARLLEPGGGVAPAFWLKRDPSVVRGEPVAEPLPVSGVLSQRAQRDAPSWQRLLTDPRWAVRLSGCLLAGAAAWALVHRLSEQWQAWCA